jgi:hypothetical protein
MAIIIGKVKCRFCKEKDGVIHSVCEHGIYGEVGQRIYYHPECLEMVQMDPEKFGHRMIDMAIKIEEQRKECIEDYNNHIVEEYKKKVEKLHRHHFERMMRRNQS